MPTYVYTIRVVRLTCVPGLEGDQNARMLYLSSTSIAGLGNIAVTLCDSLPRGPYQAQVTMNRMMMRLRLPSGQPSSSVS